MNGLQTDQVEREVFEMIQENPLLGDTSKIIVNVSKVGPIFMRKPLVQLEGTVSRELSRQKIELQISEKYGNAVELNNDLQVVK